MPDASLHYARRICIMRLAYAKIPETHFPYTICVSGIFFENCILSTPFDIIQV